MDPELLQAVIRAQLPALETLAAYTRRAVLTADREELHQEAQLVPLSLFLRLLSTVDAAIVLLREGHGREAFVLSRTTAEVVTDLAWWLTAEDAEDLALGYARWRQQLWRQAVAAAPDIFGSVTPADRLDDEEARGHREAYGRWEEIGWTAKRIDERVADIGADGRFDETMLRDVQVLRRMADVEVHPDVGSMARRLRWRDGRVQARLGPEPDAGPIALAAFVLHLVLGAHSMFLLLDLPVDPLADAFAAAHDALAEHSLPVEFE